MASTSKPAMGGRDSKQKFDTEADGIPFRAKSGHLHHTWARTYSSIPELLIQPESLQEIEKVVNLARKWRRRICMVGSGHSPSELTCSSSWIVNLDKFNKILSFDTQTGVITVQSGIRLFDLCEELDRYGLAMNNLGSINDQSMGGVFATGTHGSSLRHGLLSEDIISLKIILADGKTRTCSATQNLELFRAALLSLGALGIITEVTYKAVPAFSLKWKQTIVSHGDVLAEWERGLWTQAEFVRVWWLPYTKRAVVWKADHSTEPHVDPPTSYYDGSVGYQVYHNLLWLSHHIPSLVPWVEWFVYGMQFGFRNGGSTVAVQPSRKALLLNCLYSQSVNEWAIPLSKGPEALRRLGSWLHRLKPGDAGYVEHNIPFSAEGVYVHAPVEVRVSDTTVKGTPRPYLDPTSKEGPSLYLNAIMYRPYLIDPHTTQRYYQAFEWLMRDLGGRPHWAKNFLTKDFAAMYGEDLTSWKEVRDGADPEGMFIGPWHRQFVLGPTAPKLALEEDEVERKPGRRNGICIKGQIAAGL
jgi:D-arabinono-1,4-lactone oxidase